MESGEGLKREIGLWGLTANIVNIVIGSGIFILPAIVAEQLGASGILAYLLCGFLITAIMLCFAEVGSKITVTGGAYAYIEAAFGPYLGFLTTNIFVFGSSLMAASAVANALALTLSYLFPVFSNPWIRAGFLLAVFTLLTVVNILGVKKGITLVKIITVIKLTPLLLLVLWGSTKVESKNLIGNSLPTWDSLGAISLILFFAFQGAETGLSISGEVKKPNRTIPLGILFGFIAILLFYIAIQLVSQGVLRDSFANYKDAPLAEVARRVMGPVGLTLMIAGAAVSMLGYLSSDSLSTPRVLFRAAKDGVMPFKNLTKVHPKYATPYVSILVYALLCCFFSITGEFRQLAIFASSAALLIYLGVALAVIKLRLNTEKYPAAFRIPGGYTVPIIAIVTILWFLSHLTAKEWTGLGVFLSVISLVYFLLKQFKIIERPL